MNLEDKHIRIPAEAAYPSADCRPNIDAAAVIPALPRFEYALTLVCAWAREERS